MWKRLLSAAMSLWSAVRLSAYLARNPCDLVITSTIVIPVGALAATFLRIRHVWWIHEFGKEDHGLKFDLGERFSTWVMDHTSVLILANSIAVASKFKGLITEDKVRLLYYSVHLNSTDAGRGLAYRPTTQKPRVCVPGRITETKGQQDAIWALKKLKDDGIDADFLFVGSTKGSYAKQLAILCEQLGVGGQVEFTGHVDNPLPIMSSCDVAVVCSRCEAFGRVTIEAMKLGMPVVGTRSGGTAELIQDGFNGFLYAVGNSDDLASRLRMLVTDAELRKRMGKSARMWASERFTRAKFRDELIRHLSHAIHSQHPSDVLVPDGKSQTEHFTCR